MPRSLDAERAPSFRSSRGCGDARVVFLAERVSAERGEHIGPDEEIDAPVRPCLRIAEQALGDDALATLHRGDGRVRGRERPRVVAIDLDLRESHAPREVVEDRRLEPLALPREEPLEVEALVVRRALVVARDPALAAVPIEPIEDPVVTRPVAERARGDPVVPLGVGRREDGIAVVARDERVGAADRTPDRERERELGRVPLSH